MFSTLQEYLQASISAAWMIILSFIDIPQGVVRAGAILLGFLICMHARRPRTLMKTLQLRLSSLEEKLQDAVDSGLIMRQSDATFTNRFTRDIGRWVVDIVSRLLCPQYTLFRIRYMTFELYERTLMTSGGTFQEIKAVWQGLSLEINECIRDVDALERDFEVCSSELLPSPVWHYAQINRAKILKNHYHLWRWQAELNHIPYLSWFIAVLLDPFPSPCSLCFLPAFVLLVLSGS